jgi:predicted TIM-barrel fold metal-dependent hydrolase
MNRWVEAEWLIDPRLKGSIVVPYEDADAAVAEIERWAGDPRFVQVLMVTRTANPPGQKQYWRATRPPPLPVCRSASMPSASAVILSPAAAGRRSTSRTWSVMPSRRNPSSPAW